MDNDWWLCEQCDCKSCGERDNCAMCGCDGGGCVAGDQEPHNDCDDYRPAWD